MDFGIIEKLTKCIIRPTRATYNLSDLGTRIANIGPTGFEHRNSYYERVDFTVLNSRSQ